VADESAILANFVATARDRAAAAEHAGYTDLLVGGLGETA
jgi:hypothetical protein